MAWHDGWMVGLAIGLHNYTTETFINDATKAWNRAPKTVHDSVNYNAAKKNIKIFAKSLPI